MYKELDIKLKQWYTKTYPEDELGYEIDANATFNDLFEYLDGYLNVYDLIGVGDNVIRERLFQKLSQLMGTDYDYVYDQWLNG